MFLFRIVFTAKCTFYIYSHVKYEVSYLKNDYNVTKFEEMFYRSSYDLRMFVFIGVAIGGARGAIAPPLFKSKGLSPSTFYK